MKYLGIRKKSGPDVVERANTDQDLQNWRQHEEQEKKSLNKESEEVMEEVKPKKESLPAGVVGVMEEDGINVLFAKQEPSHRFRNMKS